MVDSAGSSPSTGGRCTLPQQASSRCASRVQPSICTGRKCSTVVLLHARSAHVSTASPSQVQGWRLRVSPATPPCAPVVCIPAASCPRQQVPRSAAAARLQARVGHRVVCSIQASKPPAAQHQRQVGVLRQLSVKITCQRQASLQLHWQRKFSVDAMLQMHARGQTRGCAEVPTHSRDNSIFVI